MFLDLQDFSWEIQIILWRISYIWAIFSWCFQNSPRGAWDFGFCGLFLFISSVHFFGLSSSIFHLLSPSSPSAIAIECILHVWTEILDCLSSFFFLSVSLEIFYWSVFNFISFCFCCTLVFGMPVEFFILAFGFFVCLWCVCVCVCVCVHVCICSFLVIVRGLFLQLSFRSRAFSLLHHLLHKAAKLCFVSVGVLSTH